MRAVIEILADLLRERGWREAPGDRGGPRSRWFDPLDTQALPFGFLAAIHREILRDIRGAAGYERLHRQAERAKEGGER